MKNATIWTFFLALLFTSDLGIALILGFVVENCDD
jgi:hypothetical protein